MYENKLKRRIRRIVEKNCARGRVREMDDAVPGMGEPDEDVRELAKYHALNGDKDHMLYRDNPDYKDAYDEMTMRESLLRRKKMKITKRQLKRIIREEYSRLQRKGLLREMNKEFPHADVPSRPGGGYNSQAANALADELMKAFPYGSSYDDGLEYALMSGYTKDDYEYALDILGQMEKGS